jgi:hypothetical protein
MPDGKRPPEGNVINLHEVDRFEADCDFNDDMNYLNTIFNNLAARGIGTFAIVADEHMMTRFVTDINGRALVTVLLKFFEEQPEIFKAILVESIHGRIYPREGSPDDN